MRAREGQRQPRRRRLHGRFRVKKCLVERGGLFAGIFRIAADGPKCQRSRSLNAGEFGAQAVGCAVSQPYQGFPRIMGPLLSGPSLKTLAAVKQRRQPAALTTSRAESGPLEWIVELM